jgi:hypothetical protein
MGQHPIEIKLRRDIVPYLVSSDQLKWQPVHVAYFLYARLGDVLAALAGAGLSHPLLEVMQDKGAVSASNLTWRTPAALAILLGWALLKVMATSNDGAKRATLMRSCRREVQQIRAKLSRILGSSSPMPELESMQVDIAALVDRHIVEGSWPFSPVCPDADSLANAEVQALVTRFGSGWEAPPPAGRAMPSGATGATGATGTTGALAPMGAMGTTPTPPGGEDHA